MHSASVNDSLNSASLPRPLAGISFRSIGGEVRIELLANDIRLQLDSKSPKMLNGLGRSIHVCTRAF